MKYYDAGIWQWRFGYDTDHAWMSECMDDKYDKFVQGVSDVEQKTPGDYTQETHFFCWQFQDKLPYEKQDDAFYTSKHGNYLTVRESTRQHKFVIIWNDKKTGRDSHWHTFSLEKLDATQCEYRNLNPDIYLDTWWVRQIAGAYHPDFRGRHKHINVPFERDLFKRGHFPIQPAGILITIDLWVQSVDSEAPLNFNTDSERKDIVDSLTALNRSGLFGDPEFSPVIEMDNFNTLNAGKLKGINLRYETEQERNSFRQHSVLGPMFTYYVDWFTEVGYNEDGKICVMHDPSLSLKQYMLNISGDQTWVDENFV